MDTIRYSISGGSYRMESVRFETREGKAKVFGTLFGVGGALVFIFYRGKDIHMWSTDIDLMNKSHDSSRDATSHHISIIGALLVFGGNFSYAFWLLLQASFFFHFSSPYRYACGVILIKEYIYIYIKEYSLEYIVMRSTFLIVLDNIEVT